MKISVLGCGAWGTAIAVAASKRHSTLLWGRDPDQVMAIGAARQNRRYLPGVGLPLALRVEASWDAALAHAQGGLIIVATPMAGLRKILTSLPPGTRAAVLTLSKGFEGGTGLLGHEVAAQTRPDLRVGVLSGPSFALEVAQGQPTALVAASQHESVCALGVEALHSDVMRVYASSDPVGVEVGGAVKNVMAIASGIADGMQMHTSRVCFGSAQARVHADAVEGAADAHTHSGLGLNARAALITRGLAETSRLGLALGARSETFMGLSGLGDLVLTCTGNLSRNRQVGLRLAAGFPLADVLRELGHVAEGVSTAPVVLQRAQALGVAMPVTSAVVSVLQGEATPAAALMRLMSRDATREL